MPNSMAVAENESWSKSSENNVFEVNEQAFTRIRYESPFRKLKNNPSLAAP